MTASTNIVLLGGSDNDHDGVWSTLRNRLLGALPNSTLEVVMEPGIATAILEQRLESKISAPKSGTPIDLTGWLESMFISPARDGTVAVVQSLQCDLIATGVFRNRAEGYLVQPPDGYRSLWDREAIDWFDSEFELSEPADPESIRSMLGALKDALPEEVSLIVLNTPTVFPGDDLPSSTGESMRMRANRLALALDRAAADSGFLAVDVDRLVAELGAADHVVELGHYSEAACDSIAEEASELVLDLREMAALFAHEGMQLVMPRYDRRTNLGVIEKWHMSAGEAVAEGHPMFDIRFDDLNTRLTAKEGAKTGKNLRLTVFAADDGFLHEIVAGAGATVPAGNLVGVMSRDGSSPPEDVSASRRFRVGLRRDEVDRGKREGT